MTLLLASWMIALERRATIARTNFQRLVALENQTLQDDLATIRDEVARINLVALENQTLRDGLTTIRDEVGRIAGIADSSNRSVASIGNVMVDAIKATELRLDTLKAGSLETASDINGIGRLRATIERISRFQKITEERLSDEIRFNIERSKIADASLKALANRAEAFSERLNALVQDQSDLSALVKSLPQSVPPFATDARHDPTSARAEYSNTQPNNVSNTENYESESYADVACPNDEAA
jgi:hypothetical protein